MYHQTSNFKYLSSVKWHDDVIKWKHFPRYWPFVRRIHRSPVNSPHKGQWRGALMFSLICARINGWVNNREAGDLRRHQAHCDVIVMVGGIPVHMQYIITHVDVTFYELCLISQHSWNELYRVISRQPVSNRAGNSRLSMSNPGVLFIWSKTRFLEMFNFH